MSIRIRFPREEPPSVDLVSYPLTELTMSLQTVASPGEHPALAPFVRRVRSRLPRSVLHELRELTPLLGPPAPAPFAFPMGEPLAVPDALDAVPASDEALHWTLAMFADEFSSMLPATDESRVLTAEIERDPVAVAERLLQLLRDYWTHAFSLEWPDVEARLALAHVDAERQLALGGVGALLAASTRRARLSEHGISVTPTIPCELDVQLQEDGRMPIVPSLFTAPYVITRISPSAGLVVPAPVAERRVTAPSMELVRGLDAVSDPTRLTLLRLVASRPRSTRELAELVGLSEAAVSKHLRRLADADLVRGQRNGYYVLYTLVPERAVAASRALLDFLHVASDSPAG